MTHVFSGAGPGVQTDDGCSVELYRDLPYFGELGDILDPLRLRPRRFCQLVQKETRAAFAENIARFPTPAQQESLANVWICQGSRRRYRVTGFMPCRAQASGTPTFDGLQ